MQFATDYSNGITYVINALEMRVGSGRVGSTISCTQRVGSRKEWPVVNSEANPLTERSVSCQKDWWRLSRQGVPMLNFVWTNHRFRYFHCLFEWKWVKFVRCCQIRHNFTCIDYLCRLDKTFNFTDKFKFDTFFKTKFGTSWHITRLPAASFAKLSAFKNSAGFLAHPAV